jgi:hypothetical protein
MQVELVNDAEPLVRDALLYPLSATLASGKAQALLDDGFAEVSIGVLRLYRPRGLQHRAVHVDWAVLSIAGRPCSGRCGCGWRDPKFRW